LEKEREGAKKTLLEKEKCGVEKTLEREKER